MARRLRSWTAEEEAILLRQVKAFPQNLNRGFNIVAEEIDRTPSAVANHWYTKLSKDPDVMCFFTASPVHVSRNRKNGIGTQSNASIWRRLLNVIKNLV